MAKKKEPRRAIALGQTAIVKARPYEAVALQNGFAVCVNGLIVEGNPSFDQCIPIGNLLPKIEKAAQFAIGDFINFLEDRFGEQASQIIDYEGGWSQKTCDVYQWLARRISSDDRRMDRLTIRHHMAVAALTPAQQRKWLHRAAADDEDTPWSVARLIAAMREGEDLPETGWYVLVRCESDQAQRALMDRLELEGLAVKAVTRRTRRKPEEAAA